MGTRHLIAVQLDGEYKIAQYGQWDGYPEGQGVGVLSFLTGEGNISKLKENLSKVRFIDSEKDREFLDAYDKNVGEFYGDTDNRTPEQKHWFESYITRNLGSDILKNIAESNDSEILLKNRLSFAGDSLFCEWAYVIDYDKNTFEVYKGFNQDRLDESERFYGYVNTDEYSSGVGYNPIKLVKSYSLDALPDETTFLADVNPRDDED